MKKLKIMLLSFALIAIVGAALAFRAKFDQPYCTTIPNVGVQHPGFCTSIDEPGLNKTCPIQLEGTDQGPNRRFYCYTLDGDEIFDCKLPDETTPLRCITTTTSLTTNE